jgi:hypothetical protein
MYWASVTKHINENELERVQLDFKLLSGRRKTWQDVERTSALNIAKKITGSYIRQAARRKTRVGKFEKRLD